MGCFRSATRNHGFVFLATGKTQRGTFSTSSSLPPRKNHGVRWTLKLTFQARPVKSPTNNFRLAQPDYVMKLSPRFFFTVAASLAVLATAALPVVAQTPVERVARVNALAGVASYSTKGGAFTPLAIGAKLHQGDTVKTTAGSHVDIDLGGNVGIVQVAPQSTFVLDKITTTDAGPERLTQTELRVDAGAIYAKINKLAKGSRYEISTPKGIAGIRGT